MATSILHRVSGNGLATVGLAVLLWFVGSLAAGAAAYETFTAVMGSPIGIIVLIGVSWSFFNHLMSGIRHLVLDVGAGYEVDRNNRWSVITILLGIFLTVLFWAVILFV